MDTNPPLPQPEYPVIETSPGIFRTKTPSSIAFIAAVLLFLLPFMEVKCNGMTIYQFSGLQLAVGTKTSDKWSMDNDRYDGESRRDNYSTTSTKNERRSSNKFALIALALGVLGIVLSYSDARKGGIGGMITGGMAAISMILLFIDIKRKVKRSVMSLSDLDKEMNGEIDLRVVFTVGFYLALLAFIAACYFGYRRWKADYR